MTNDFELMTLIQTIHINIHENMLDADYQVERSREDKSGKDKIRKDQNREDKSS